MFECKCFIQDMGNAVLTLSITVLLSASSPQPLKIDTLTFKSYLYYCYYLDLWYIATCTVHVYIAAYKWQWWQWVKLIHYFNIYFFLYEHALNIIIVPTGSDGTPRVVTVQPHIIFIGVAILVTMVLLLLIASIPVGCIIRLVSTPEYTWMHVIYNGKYGTMV